MTRDEVLAKIEEARKAIAEFKRDNMARTSSPTDAAKVEKIRKASGEYMVEARTIGAAGSSCPACGGSGRV